MMPGEENTDQDDTMANLEAEPDDDDIFNGQQTPEEHHEGSHLVYEEDGLDM